MCKLKKGNESQVTAADIEKTYQYKTIFRSSVSVRKKVLIERIILLKFLINNLIHITP